VGSAEAMGWQSSLRLAGWCLSQTWYRNGKTLCCTVLDYAAFTCMRGYRMKPETMAADVMPIIT
jgi:hypothetical protein